LDVIRTLLLATVGAIDLTDEKMRSVVDELVRRGELAAAEAQELLARWRKEAAGRSAELDARLRTAVEDALGRYNVASHTSVAELQARLAALEQRVAAAAAPPGDRP
jgi:polyhydroxyalkanoate synthesis regulator phasin